MSNKELAKKILKLVGGDKNIDHLTHCFTRLRFNLKDNSKANIQKLSELEGVIEAQVKGGQVQVIIGSKVADVYAEVVKIANIKTEKDKNEKDEETDQGFWSRILKIIVGIFTPILPAMAGAGLIKSLTVLLGALGWTSESSGFITILNMIGDSVFYFLPFFLSVGAARVFKTKESLAIALAAALMHPTILNAAPAIASGNLETLNFLGLPLLLFNYSNTVFPIILSVWLLSYVYKYVNKIIPDFLRIVLTPVVVLLIMVPVELIAIAPLGMYFGNFLSIGIDFLFAKTGILAGALLGFFRPILVMFGMHYSLIPIQIQQIGQQGFTLLMPSALAANFAQAGAAFAVFFLLKNKTMKSVAGSSALTATFGITEPAIYGVNLKYKKPFFASCLAAAITSGFYIIVNARTVAMGLPGILSLGNNEADKFIYIIIGVLMSFGLSFVFTLIAGIDEENEGEQGEQNDDTEVEQQIDDVQSAQNVSVFSPLVGKIRPLSEVDDKTFSQELLGKGSAILPSEGKVYAPFDGKIDALFKTKHAVGLKGKNGVELLIHIGLDTVNLEGKHFTSHVEQGETVTAGQLLIEFDMDAIKKEGYELITPVIVTNSNDYADVHVEKTGNITEKEVLFTVTK